MTSPSLTFLGATGTVTGSRFLVETGASRVLVDAGLYQGLRELRRRNWAPFPVDPATLDAVVLTHAHLDHVGYLPLLVRDGFAGPVVCTEETAELAAIVLRDSAHLQEEDAAYANEAGFSKHQPARPLYDASDVEKTLPLLESVPFHSAAPVTPDVTATLRSAGHILGSSSVLVEAGGTRTLFSGDLGRRGHPLVAAREDPPAADVVVCESTYGDRAHPVPATDVLADAIRRTVERHGTVLVPAFAVDRTELVLVRIGQLMQQGLVPTVPVFVDSPMALSTLEVYRRALSGPGPGPASADLPAGWDPVSFGVPDLRPVRDARGSEQLNRPRHPCIVISASGMATGGRVVHHLAHQLQEPRNTVVLTGYQAVGTRGRDLLEGARQLKIHGRYVPVRAEIVDDPEFSVHADASEILDWLRTSPVEPSTLYAVHGEPDAARALARRVREELGWCAVVPKYGERVRLD